MKQSHLKLVIFVICLIQCKPDNVCTNVPDGEACDRDCAPENCQFSCQCEYCGVLENTGGDDRHNYDYVWPTCNDFSDPDLKLSRFDLGCWDSCKGCTNKESRW